MSPERASSLFRFNESQGIEDYEFSNVSPAREPRAFGHGLELRPHDRWMHATVDFFLRESAVGPGNHILPSDEFRKSDDAISDQAWMFDRGGVMRHHPWNQDPAGRELHVLPDAPLMLVSRVRGLD